MNKWVLLPIVLAVALIAVLLLNQPKTFPVEGADYIKTESGDEYLQQDYITEEEEGIGDLELTKEEQGKQYAASLKGCSELEGDEADWCYIGYSFATGDLEGCGKIEEEYNRDSCIANTASVRQDPSICGQVKFDREECYTNVAIDVGEPSYCEKGKEARAKCFEAFEKSDPTLCSQTYDKRFCNDAIDQKNVDLCNNIVDYSGDCYYEIATAKNDVQLCGKVSIEALKNQCIFSIATTVNDARLCEQLKETRDNCVAWVALNTNNKSLCYEAGTETESCIADLEYFETEQ